MGRPRKYPIEEVTTRGRKKILNNDDTKPKKLRRNQTINTKLNNGFVRFRQELQERQQVGITNYFRGLTLDSLWWIIVAVSTCLFIIELGYVNMAIYPIESHTATLLFFIPFALTILFSFVFTDLSNTHKGLFILYPILLILSVTNFLLKGNVSSYILIPVIGIIAGRVASFVALLELFKFDRAERLISVVIFCLLFFGSYSFKVIAQSLNWNVNIASFIAGMLFLLASSIIVNIKSIKIDVDTKYHVDRDLPLVHVFVIFIIFTICANFGVLNGINNSLNVFHQAWFERSYPDAAYIIGLVAGVLIAITVFIYSKQGYIKIIITYFICLLLTLVIGLLFTANYLAKLDAYLVYSFLFIMMIAVTTALSFISGVMLLGKIFGEKRSRKLINIYALFAAFFMLGGALLGRAIPRVLKSVASLTGLFNGMIIIDILIFTIGLIVNFNSIDAAKKGTVQLIIDNKDNYKVIDPNLVLTKSELKVFNLLIKGMRLKEVAEQAGIKYDAANFHQKNIYRKLEVNTKLELILRYSQYIDESLDTRVRIKPDNNESNNIETNDAN